jgi:hypothetical protein
MTEVFSFQDAVRVPADVFARRLPDGESVILSLETERYYALNGMGTEMWAALTSAASIEESYRRLLADYDVEPEVLRQDLQALIAGLLSQGLLELAGSDG